MKSARKIRKWKEVCQDLAGLRGVRTVRVLSRRKDRETDPRSLPPALAVRSSTIVDCRPIRYEVELLRENKI